MAYRPRKRAAKPIGRVFWQVHGTKRLLGFAGYKAGMTHVAYIDQRSHSPTKGQEVVGAATVVEVPPVYVYGIRCYNDKRSAQDVLTENANVLKILKIKKPKKQTTPSEFDDVRLLVFAQPDKTGTRKKHIERMEVGIGGKDAQEKLEYAKTLLGKEVRASEVFKPGEYVDTIAITKGKGWQGAVKRFGVATQRRKATQKVRHVGTLGQCHPAYILYTIPQAGQMGYHTRTELNKQILKIDSDVDSINPNGGFPHYGFVRNDYILLKGSIPGPYKRLVRLRLAVRPQTMQEPKVSYVAK